MATSADFETAVAFVLREEGGYLSPERAVAIGDVGGETKYGISKRSYPWLDIAALTEADARAIYFRDYWQPSGAAALPMPLAQVVLDTAANMGPEVARHLTAQSGGDVGTYLQLRAAEYQHIAATQPTKAKFLPVWLGRVRRLAQAIGGVSGVGAAAVLAVLIGWWMLRGRV